MPSNSAIRNVQRDFNEPDASSKRGDTKSVNRPRDAAIRTKAFNDNLLSYKNPTDKNNRVSLGSIPDTASTFNEGYMQRGLQPSVGNVAPIRNAQTEYKQTDAQKEQVRKTDFTQNATVIKSSIPVKSAVSNLKKAATSSSSIKTLGARRMAVQIMALSSAWLPLAVILQVFAGIACLVFMGLLSTGNFLVDGLNALLNTDDALKFFLFIPFIITLFVVIVLSLLYQIAGVNSFFGKHSGLKIGVLIFVLVASMFPLFNIFPFYYLWMMVLIRYPK